MMTMLPPLALPVGQMSKKDLVSFIPQMLRSATGRVRPPYGKQDQKPIWWPKEVPWSSPRVDRRNGKQTLEWEDALRRVIYSCYAHHGLEYMLSGELHQGSPATSGDEPPPLKRTTRSVHFTGTDPDPKREVELPLGCLNAGGVSPMHTPQDLCASPTLAGTVPTSGLPQANSPTEQGKTGSAEKNFLEVYICFFCQLECINRAVLYQHQQQCRLRLAAGCQTPPATPRTPHKNTKEKARFLDHFELVPINKLQSLRQRKKRDMNCEIIDLKNDPMPKTPTTPRSQKSLMSQLSRDLTVDRRAGEDTADSSSVRSEESEEEVKLGKASSLLCIDLTSLLGQRIKKHVGSDFKVTVEKDSDDDDSDAEGGYESFCRTPKKGHSQGRLRSRPNPFPVTYKRKRTWGPHFHKYKFNSIDKEEFRIQMRTGLDACSRHLRTTMKPCKVVMRKLTPSQIQRLSKGPRTPVTSKNMGLLGPLSAWLRHAFHNPQLLPRLQEQLSQRSASDQRLLLLSPAKKGTNSSQATSVLSPSAFYANMAALQAKGNTSTASLLMLSIAPPANGVLPSGEGKKSKASPKDKGKKQSEKAKSKKDGGSDKNEKEKCNKDKTGKDQPSQKKASKDKLLKEKIVEKKANKEKLMKSKSAPKQSEKNKNVKGKLSKENDSKKDNKDKNDSEKSENIEKQGISKVESSDKEEINKESGKEKKELNKENEKQKKEVIKANTKEKPKESKKTENKTKQLGKKDQVGKDKNMKKESSKDKVLKVDNKGKLVEDKPSKQNAKKDTYAEKVKKDVAGGAKEGKKDASADKARKEAVGAKESKKDTSTDKARKEVVVAKEAKKDTYADKVRKEAVAAKESKKDASADKARKEAVAAKESKKDASADKARKEAVAAKESKKDAIADKARKEVKKNVMNDKSSKADSGKQKVKEKEKKGPIEKKGTTKDTKNKPNSWKKTKQSAGNQKGSKESKGKAGSVKAGKENRKDPSSSDSKSVTETSSKEYSTLTTRSPEVGTTHRKSSGDAGVVCHQQSRASPAPAAHESRGGKAGNMNASQDKSSRMECQPKVAKDGTCTSRSAEARELQPTTEGGLRRSRRRGSVDSIDSLSSKGSLPRQLQRKPDCDVISISSSEGEEVETIASRKRPRRSSTDSRSSQPSKRTRRSSPVPDMDGELSSQAVLFKCHLCYAEIMFNLATTDFIRNHFADKHNVPNIQILEHRDQNNQLVLSIVEDTPLPADSRRSTRRRDGEASANCEVICIDD